MKPNRPDISLIRKYLNGELDERAMYQLERQAQDDPALLDLIEGMEMGDQASDEATLIEINSLIQQRSQAEKTVKFVPWKTWSVAASLLVLCGVGVLWLQQRKPEATQVVQKTKKIPVPQDQPLIPEAEVSAKLSENKEVIASVIHKQKAKIPEINTLIRIESPAMESAQPAPIEANKTASARMSTSALAKRMDSAFQSDGDLHEVVVAGYGAQKKSVDARSMLKPDSNVASTALAGKVAGVSVQSADQRAIRIRGKSSIDNAEPESGWKAYSRYLEKKAKKINGVTGIVVLTFNLDQEGRPIEVVVLNGLTDAANQKAIELLNKGSKWKRPAGTDGRITLVIQFH